MNLQKIIILSLAVLAIGAGVWYLTKEPVTPAATVNTDNSLATSQEETLDDNFSGTGSLAAIMASGGSFRCDFSSQDEESASTGTFYFNDGRYRVDVDVTMDGTLTESHMINDSATTYAWSETPDGMMGMMFANVEYEDVPYDSSTDSNPQPVDVDESVDYNCIRASVDSALFVPPSDVEFTDMNAMMDNMMENMPEGFELPEGFPAN